MPANPDELSRLGCVDNRKNARQCRWPHQVRAGNLPNNKSGWMFQFWDRVTAPVIEALRPQVILHIGGTDGRLVSKLIGAAARIGGALHVATLTPGFDVDAARRQVGDRLVVHRARGLAVVPLLPVPDLVLIDDDPNWFNVYHLLTALQRQADRSDRPFPVVLLTQVGWPYGRRDSYDEPAAVPAAFRQVYERSGVVPGASALSPQNGLFADRFNAAAENKPQSGVLTALEDFIDQGAGRFITTLLPMFHGIALLQPLGGPAEPMLASVVAALTQGSAAAALSADLEAARVALEIAAKAAAEERARAAHRNEALHAALRAAQQLNVEDHSAAILARALLRRSRRAVRARLRGDGGAAADRAADLARLHSSALFDADWYVARYPDAAGALDPALHYLSHQGRDPCPDFSAHYYLSTYADVADAGHDPLLHYLASGAGEGRNPSPLFSTRFYLETYPEVARDGHNPLEHYVRYGREEGRRTHD